MWQKIIKDAEEKMKKTISVTTHELSLIRTGRANPSLLDGIKVNYYGAPTPLKQLATVTSPEPRMMVIQPYDISSVKEIEKAILGSDLGLTPSIDGQIIRIAVPTLSKDRREELVKVVKKVAEDGRVSIRSSRRDGIDHVKRLETEKKISEDERHKAQDEIQKLTDRNIRAIDQASESKERDLLVP